METSGSAPFEYVTVGTVTGAPAAAAALAARAAAAAALAASGDIFSATGSPALRAASSAFFAAFFSYDVSISRTTHTVKINFTVKRVKNVKSKAASYIFFRRALLRVVVSHEMVFCGGRRFAAKWCVYPGVLGAAQRAFALVAVMGPLVAQVSYQASYNRTKKLIDIK
jgi:hypothetical protein